MLQEKVNKRDILKKFDMQEINLLSTMQKKKENKQLPLENNHAGLRIFLCSSLCLMMVEKYVYSIFKGKW